MFIETKVWISDYGYDQTRHAFEKSASKLGVGHEHVAERLQPVLQSLPPVVITSVPFHLAD